MNREPSYSHIEHSRSVSKFIQGLLTENDDETHVVFCQLDCLSKNKDNEVIWQESARWVKYEEDVEQNGKRWSKPHVSSVALSHVFELKAQLNAGALVFDADIKNVKQLADVVIHEVSKTDQMNEKTKDTLRSVLMTRHVHPHLKRQKNSTRNSTQQSTSTVQTGRSGKHRYPEETKYSNGINSDTTPLVKMNKPLMRKIPEGSEVANVWVGEVEDLRIPVTAFIRLSEPRFIGDLTEVKLPTRFIFIHLSPPGVTGNIFEIGRAMSNMMVDQIFSEVAYKAKTREDIVNGFDEYLDQVTALPPGQWDPEIRIEPPVKVPSQEPRKSEQASEAKEDEEHGDPTLIRTGRLFGGLIDDVRRKLPFYASDFKDGIHIQCLATILYMYLATLTPTITFGALLGQSTDLHIGTMECIVTMAFVELSWALFSGQPLIIMGSTGPLLVLEVIIYQMCKDNSWNFLEFRLWVGLWLGLMLMIIVAFDLSALVRYITRFTEESFALLIALIFIIESFKKIFSILQTHPFNAHPEVQLDYTCSCVPGNGTIVTNMTSSDVVSYSSNSTFVNWTTVAKEDCINLGGILEGSGCDTPVYYDNVFFFSFILGIGTFALAWTFMSMKTSTFFPTTVRQMIGDFAVFLSVCIMVSLDIIVGVQTPKLNVPDKIQPSRADRGWFVSPYGGENPWWTMIATALPAIVACILVFLDQQITAVIVNRKEYKLKKGCGYHLDLLVCTICIIVCSFCGLPWFVAATVRSMSHINSLKMESECAAPGEKPVFLGCREQRVTAICIALLNGCSVFITKVLQLVPMPVLYGVFLYMGISALRGMQFFDRILIMLMPGKYQPDHMYLRHVRIKRVHIFTLIQILCLVILWVIKAIKSISIAFPVMVLGTCFVRKGMEKFFTRNELKWLDELMPEDKMRKLEDEGELIVDDDDDGDSDDDDAFVRESAPWDSAHNGKPQKRNISAPNKFILGDIEKGSDTHV